MLGCIYLDRHRVMGMLSVNQSVSVNKKTRVGKNRKLVVKVHEKKTVKKIFSLPTYPTCLPYLVNELNNFLKATQDFCNGGDILTCSFIILLL